MSDEGGEDWEDGFEAVDGVGGDEEREVESKLREAEVGDLVEVLEEGFQDASDVPEWES